MAYMYVAYHPNSSRSASGCFMLLHAVCYYMLYAANYSIDFSDSSFSTDQDYLFASPSQVLIAS